MRPGSPTFDLQNKTEPSLDTSWQAFLSSASLCPLPHRLVESRPFYTAYLQRLSGLTRTAPQTTAVPAVADKVAPTVWKLADR